MTTKNTEKLADYTKFACDVRNSTLTSDQQKQVIRIAVDLHFPGPVKRAVFGSAHFKAKLPQLELSEKDQETVLGFLKSAEQVAGYY